MKYNFQDLNLAPMPNPKPIKVLRVRVEMEHTEKAAPGGSSYGFITNANVHPAALIRGW